VTPWSRERLEALRGRPVLGRGAAALGTVTEVLFDPGDGRGWIAIETGRAVVIVRLDGTTVTTEAVLLPLEATQVRALAERKHAGRLQLERF
jgi:hypothetical protein